MTVHPRISTQAERRRDPAHRGDADHVVAASEKDAKLAKKLGQLQPYIAVFPQGCTRQLASFGPT